MQLIELVKKMDLQRDFYQSPAILHQVTVRMEGSILTASIHENMTVETTGQEVVTYGSFDAGDTGFNHEWH